MGSQEGEMLGERRPSLMSSGSLLKGRRRWREDGTRSESHALCMSEHGWKIQCFSGEYVWAFF